MELNKAAYKHDHKLVEQLLDEGQRPNAMTLCNLVTFESKSDTRQARNLALIKRVIELGVNPNKLPWRGHASAVDLAAAYPNSETLAFLLEIGAKPDPGVAVHYAIEEDLVDNLQVLIDYGVDLHTPKSGEKPDDALLPLEYAKLTKARKCLRLLRTVLEE